MKIFILIFLVTLIGCKKDNTKIIVPDVVFLSDFGTCFSNFSEDTPYVIRDKLTFYEIMESVRTNDSTCDTASIPEIDFNNYSLIGYLTIGICSIDNEKNILLNESEKTYHYLITINYNEKPTCKILVATMNWALIPKLPKDYSVEFIITKKYKNE